MERDVRGYPLDTDNAAARESFDTAIARFFEFRLDAVDHADAAIAADPDSAMAQLLKGYLLTGAQSRKLRPIIEGHIRKAEARQGGLSDRASGWLDGLRALHANDLPGASAVFYAHLTRWPRDLFIIKQLQQQTLFWRGRSLDLRDSVLRLGHAWDDTVPGHPHFLGMLAFGYEESGDYAAAERAGRACVERAPDDIWGIHSVAHVLEMQGRHQDGLNWINYAPDAWADRSPLARHVWWHKALFAWDSGDHDQALALFDAQIYPEKTAAYIDVQNAASLLWRLEMAGASVGDRWETVAQQAEETLEDQMLAFTDTHVAMALARTGRGEALARQRQTLAERADGDGYAASLSANVTMPLADAISAYMAHDYSRAVDGFLATREHWASVGGSHAQRDLYAQALLDAAVKAGDAQLANSLLAERAALHPASKGLEVWRASLAA